MKPQQANPAAAQVGTEHINEHQIAPDRGPRLLFFSGGTALTGLSKALKHYTHNSIHLVTPFDSGGSSATLRKAFAMPAIGDLRSRLLTLADETMPGYSEINRLFATRLPKGAKSAELESELNSLVTGKSPLLAKIGTPTRRLLCEQLACFRQAMPDDFGLQGASIGNLILTGSYLNNQRQLEPTIHFFSELLGVQGTVKLISTTDLHLGAELADGRQLLGEHKLTGKDHPPITTPIRRLFLSKSQECGNPASACIDSLAAELIQGAELICYPPGSFYSSLLANLLPQGVSTEIARNPCPKVYIPNLGHDPEQIGMTLDDCLLTLIKQLHAGCDEQTPIGKLLNIVIVDSKRGEYPSTMTQSLLDELGIQLIDTTAISAASQPYFDNIRMAEVLLQLAQPLRNELQTQTTHQNSR